MRRRRIWLPYRHARLSAMKLAGDPNAHKDLEDGASLEELKKLVEYHLERVAPVTAQWEWDRTRRRGERIGRCQEDARCEVVTRRPTFFEEA